jgi:tetratricopeptide (TPR) repeat protein
MSKDKLQLLSPLFLKYQIDFEKNPRSRVFAPLAETYRKLGMTDKAMEILSQGIRFHPTYLMGYLGLAFCYFDLKQYNLSYTTLRPLVDSNRDNIRLQKLFSDVCLQLNRKEEALETLKYLLFINPRDKDTAELVKAVEKDVDDQYKTEHKPIIIPEKVFQNESGTKRNSSFFNLNKLENQLEIENNVDNWQSLDLVQDLDSSLDLTKYKDNSFENWNVKKNEFKNNVEEKLEIKESLSQQLSIKESHENFKDDPEAERDYFVELNLEDDSDPMIEAALRDTFKQVPKAKPETSIHVSESHSIQNNLKTPLVTHTLVDLYCGQGHIEKALEVLKKILLLNPNDHKTIQKIKEIQALVQPLEHYDEKVITALPKQNQPKKVENEISEEEGRRNLMSLIDKNIGPEMQNVETQEKKQTNNREKKLLHFLKIIQKRALDYQARV